MAYAESWHVRARGRTCSATQRPFVDQEIIITALFPDPESGGYLRRDFGIDTWKERTLADDAPFSFWKTTYSKVIKQEDENSAEKLSAEEILKRLIEEDLDHTENARFILAVMLERQKLLRETSNQSSASGIIRIYEHRKTGEVFIIKDPNIPLCDVETVQHEVFALLENNGRSSGSEEFSQDESELKDPESAPESL